MDIVENKKDKNVTSFRYYLLYFLIYAFIGWLMETFYAFSIAGHFVKRGFLYGPLCPIYGWGGIILISLLNRYKSNSLKLFFYSAIVFSLFEYLVGFGLDALFSAKWWDYTYDFMNLNGRISIFYSVGWGFIALVFINHVHPFIEKKVQLLLNKVPKTIQLLLLNSAFALFVTDTVFSSLRHLHIF